MKTRHIKRLLAGAVLSAVLAATAWAASFDAISKVKDRVPFDEKKRVWYSGEWTQRRFDSNVWEVRASDGVWKVSPSASLCAETGRLVDVCSKNGTAKRYTGLPYCKPPSVCAP